MFPNLSNKKNRESRKLGEIAGTTTWNFIISH